VTPRAVTMIRFPARRGACVWIMREGRAWLVVALGHGWLFGSRGEALADARWLARTLGLPVRSALEPKP
jgi:hypothetical protein